MNPKAPKLTLQSVRGCVQAYEDLANATLRGDVQVKEAGVAERCIKGAVYVGGTLPAKVAELIHRYKGSPYTDIPLVEAEGKKMLREGMKPSPKS